MRCYLGLDLGGTKCDVLIGDENGKILARHIGPGWDDDYIGGLVDCAKQACANADISIKDLSGFVSSMAGADYEEDIIYNRREIIERIGNDRCTVYPEMAGSLRAETTQKPSCVFSCGTGMGVAYYREDGTFTDLSNYVCHDLQGGGALGHKAFSIACASSQGIGEATCLVDYICEFAENDDLAGAMMHFSHGQDPFHEYQHFAPYLFKAAIRHDKVALQIIQEAGARMSEYLRAVFERLNIGDSELPVVFTGGMFKGHGHIMEEAIKRNLLDYPHVQYIRAKYEPVYGALMLAYDEYLHNDKKIQVAKCDFEQFKLLRSD